MKVYDLEAVVCVSITKRVLATSAEDARKHAKGLSLPDVVSCSPDDDDFWDVGGELDGAVNGIEATEAEDE